MNSRRRLLEWVNTVNYRNIGESYFGTFTYPDECLPRDYHRLAKDRKYLFEALESKMQRHVPVLWRVEWEPRKSGINVGKRCPHLHTIMLGVARMPYKAVRYAWRTILKSEREPSMRFEKLPDVARAAMYVAKYVAKVGDVSTNLDLVTYHLPEGAKGLGRQWGITRKSLVPMCPIERIFALTESEWKQVAAEVNKRCDWVNIDGLFGWTVGGPLSAAVVWDVMQVLGLTGKEQSLQCNLP